MRIHSSHIVHPSVHVLHLVASYALIIFLPTGQCPQYSRNLLALSNLNTVDNNQEQKFTPIRLINTNDIISGVMNNFVLLLSIGLCSPLLCFYISLSVCMNSCSWLMLIDRFVCVLSMNLPPLRSHHHQISSSPSIVLIFTHFFPNRTPN